jgi:hypothetical protein
MSDENTKAPTRYANLAAKRLGQLLDEQGYPMDLFGRVTALTKLISVQPSVATQLLSGYSPWSWDALALICAAFEKEPGFFLDREPGSAIPSDVEVVTSASGGENTVWRVPSGLSRFKPDRLRRLQYVVCAHGVSDTEAPSVMVFDRQSVPKSSLQIGDHYVIEDDGGLCVVKLKSIISNEGVAVVVDGSTDVSSRVIRVPLEPEGEQPSASALATAERARFVGVLVGQMVIHK